MKKKIKTKVHGVFIISKMLLFSVLMLISAPFFMATGNSSALSDGLRTAMNMAEELVDIGYISQREFDEFERSVFK